MGGKSINVNYIYQFAQSPSIGDLTNIPDRSSDQFHLNGNQSLVFPLKNWFFIASTDKSYSQAAYNTHMIRK